MNKTTEMIFQEILKNARNDRNKVEILRDQLLRSVDYSDPSWVAICETIVRISDSLTRNNSQLVEILKMSPKLDGKDESKDSDKDSIFDEIESNIPS